jgi:Dolichyl-phosphate-mannose-protein mannosyltransferase
MSDTTTDHPNKRLWGLLLLVSLIYAVLSRAVFVVDPFENDAGVYAAMGKSLWEGKQLYVDVWEQKPPAVAVLFAGFWGLFHNNWPLWVAAQALISTTAALVLADIVRRVWGMHKAFATFCLALLGLNCSRFLTTGFQIEPVLALPASLAAWIAVFNLKRRNFLLAVLGLLAGLAGSIKPTALSVVAAYGLTALFFDRSTPWSKRLVPCVGMTLGVLLMVGANLVLFTQLNLWPYIGDVWKEIGLYGKGTPWSQALAPKTFIILGLAVWSVLLFAVWPKVENRWGAGLVAAFAATWLLVEIVGVIVQKRAYFYHFTAALPPAVLLTGLIGARAAVLPTIFAMVPWIAISMHWNWNIYNRGDGDARVIAYLNANTQRDDAVFGDPLGELMVRSDTQAGARLVMLINAINHDDAAIRWRDDVLADLEERRPKYMVMPIPERMEDRIAGWERQGPAPADIGADELIRNRLSWSDVIGRSRSTCGLSLQARCGRTTATGTPSTTGCR